MFNATTLDDIQTKSGLNFTFASSKPGEVITNLLPYIYGIAGIVLILNVITSGLSMMTSAGEPKALQAAQHKLSNSLIGIIILFASFFIVRLILQFLGINVEVFN